MRLSRMSRFSALQYRELNLVLGPRQLFSFFFLNYPATPEISPLPLPDPLPIRPRRNVAALPHLRATANERVRINHRAFAHIRPHVHEHRRHANHAAANVGSDANARAPRNDAHFIGSRERDRKSVV